MAGLTHARGHVNKNVCQSAERAKKNLKRDAEQKSTASTAAYLGLSLSLSLLLSLSRCTLLPLPAACGHLILASLLAAGGKGRQR